MLVTGITSATFSSPGGEFEFKITLNPPPGVFTPLLTEVEVILQWQDGEVIRSLFADGEVVFDSISIPSLVNGALLTSLSIQVLNLDALVLKTNQIYGGTITESIHLRDDS